MERLLITVAAVLERVPVPYAVGGSVASARHGEPRMTNDLDVLVALEVDQIEAFRAAFGEGWYLPDAGLGEAVLRSSSFNAIHLAWMDKVDFFVAGSQPLQRAALARAVPVRIEAAEVAFYSAEDIVLQKLEWLRASSGILAGQRRDVVGVLKTSRASLDLAYLTDAAARCDLRSLLDPCLREAGLSP